MRKSDGWKKTKDGLTLRVGHYELVVFEEMFEIPQGAPPTIYADHSGKRLICDGLSAEAAAGMKTLEEAKRALIKRFKKIIVKEQRAFEAFLRKHP